MTVIAKSIMIEILLATSLITQHPTVWANDYCVYRGYGSTPEEAQRLATEATGEPTEEAWKLVEKNTTWCPYVK